MARNPAKRITGFIDISRYLILAKRWMQIGHQQRAVSLLIRLLLKIRSDNRPHIVAEGDEVFAMLTTQQLLPTNKQAKESS